MLSNYLSDEELSKDKSCPRVKNKVFIYVKSGLVRISDFLVVEVPI